MDHLYVVPEAPAASCVDAVVVAQPVNSPYQQLPETAISQGFDCVLNRLAAWVSWVWVLLMLVIVGNVLLRYLLGEGRVELEELQWHLYAVGWLVGLSYGVVQNAHVRIDLIHERLSMRAQAWIELAGTCLLLLPLVVLVLCYAVPFIHYSWQLGEVSVAPGGLPYRWLIKAALLIGFALLAMAVLSRLSRISALLLGFPQRKSCQGVRDGTQ